MGTALYKHNQSEYIFKTQLENWLPAGGEELHNIQFLTYAKLRPARDTAKQYLEALRRTLEKADGLDMIFNKQLIKIRISIPYIRPTVSPIVFKQQIGRALSASRKGNAGKKRRFGCACQIYGKRCSVRAMACYASNMGNLNVPSDYVDANGIRLGTRFR